MGGTLKRKPTSCRPKKLTEAQEIELRVWYYSPRTVAEKARALGIGRTAAYAYIKRLHKPRKIELTEHQRSVPRGTSGDLNEAQP